MRTVYSPRPNPRSQVHPRALEILDPIFRISDKYDDYGVPICRGIPHEAWLELVAKPRLFQELLGILHRDYPTFAALCQKIWAKKVGRTLPFIFNRVQTLFWDIMARRIANLEALLIDVLKARQLGISTEVNGFTHWNVWRQDDIEALLAVHDKPLAHSFIDRMRIFHEELPKVPGITRTLRSKDREAKVPKEELYYRETRSKATTIVVGTGRKGGSRGRSTPWNHLAEYAFYPDAAEFLGALMPQLPQRGTPARANCSVIIESTPNGKNDFYHHWQMAKEPSTEWKAVFFPWFVAEDMYSVTPPHGWKMDDEQRGWARNLAHLRKQIDGVERITPAQVYWYEQTLQDECEGNQDKMDAEYPSDDETCFLLRSQGIFQPFMRYLHQTVMESERRAPQEFAKRDIKIESGKCYLRGYLEYPPPPNPFAGRLVTPDQLKLHPKFIESSTGPLVMWEPPQPNNQYVIGIDSASGLVKSDDSVDEIVNVTKGRQIAEYVGKIPPEQLADDSVALGYFYNTAWLYPEINSIGNVTMKRIKQIWLYPNVGREELWDEARLKAHKFGHFTTNDTKYIIVSFLVDCIRKKFLSIASDALLSEMSTFVQTFTDEGTERFHGDQSNPDNRVMALGLALYCVRQMPHLYTQLMQNTHQVVTTPDMMIHDAPTPVKLGPALEGLSEEVRRGLGLQSEVLAVPSNPIRGLADLEIAI